MKKKVILFGGGQGGINFITHQDQYEVLAIADNDLQKQNSYISGYRVISPDKMKIFNFDYVIITSMFFQQIKEQLLRDFDMNEDLIKVAPKAMLKEVFRPFEDQATISFARKKLKQLVELFNKHNIRYFADFGTLLGAVRDKDIIPWDDDIDLSILLEDYETVLGFLENHLYLLNDSEIIKWTGHVTYKQDSNPTNISLKFKGGKNSGINNFQINIATVKINGENAQQELNSVPKEHFLEREFINFLGVKLSVPANYKKYLTLTYGDWRTPNKIIDYSEYQVLKDVTVTPERIPINVKG